MPRAVLDSSVLISAFLTPRGFVARLLQQPLRGRYELFLSEPILAETAEELLTKATIRRSYEYPDDAVHDYVRWLLSQAQIVSDVPDLAVVAADPKDDPIVATAGAAGADYLVTSDRRHLLPIGQYEGIRIVSPRQFHDML